jgi:hypothetical protein
LNFNPLHVFFHLTTHNRIEKTGKMRILPFTLVLLPTSFLSLVYGLARSLIYFVFHKQPAKQPESSSAAEPAMELDVLTRSEPETRTEAVERSNETLIM